jgi:hypothetical protein
VRAVSESAKDTRMPCNGGAMCVVVLAADVCLVTFPQPRVTWSLREMWRTNAGMHWSLSRENETLASAQHRCHMEIA